MQLTESTGPRAGAPISILLVEDNPADAGLTREALRTGKVMCDLNVVEDGVEAMDYLQRRGAYAHAQPPDLVLLDLNLPRMDGREVLAQMKADPFLKRVPVVVLTTSDADEDILATYELHANCYVTKPVDFQRFVQIIRSIEDFWLTVVKLPPV